MDWCLYDRDPRHERVNRNFISKVFLEPCQTSVTEPFCENSQRLFNFFAKSPIPILDALQGFKYTCVFYSRSRTENGENGIKPEVY